MSRFVLTAQLQLQAPNNVAQVVRQIQSQLNNVSVNVQVQGAAQAQRQLQQVTTQTQAATTAADRMGRAFAISIRRFAAFSIATRAVGLFTSTLSNAVREAIDFQREMVRVSQVTGEALGKLTFLSKAIKDLSTGLGVSSKDLLSTGQLLLQAGVNAKDTEIALKTLAKAALAPNFDSLSETTEGAIAILAQFGEGVGALEKQLGAINAVAGAFAVEAGDLIDVIRRAGGVFKSSGGDLNELIALFTSVRATTRESAESIGTGLRTIFTRIQRPKTIEFLKQFGVELVDLEGKFVGPFEAVKRLSTALSGLGEGDITFIRIAEELGGFRQIGKVLPLLQQFSTAQAALNVAQKAGNSLTTDAATAQQALAIRIVKVKEEFLALIRSVTETTTFQVMANTALSLASALIQIGEAIKPLLPLLAAVAAVNFARGIGTFAGGLMRGMQSGRTYNKGGKVHYFARGGMVPGTGNRDTVPAMLQPGEFVIRKSSVNKLGASNLAAMNENRYAAGGIVTNNRNNYGSPLNQSERRKLSALMNPPKGTRLSAEDKKLRDELSARKNISATEAPDMKTAYLKDGRVGGLFLQKGSGGTKGITKILQGQEIPGFPDVKQIKGNVYTGLLDSKASISLRSEIEPAISTAVENASINTMRMLEIPPLDINEKSASQNAVKRIDIGSIEGHIFEAFISAMSGANLSDPGASFDFINPSADAKKRLKNIFGPDPIIGKLLDAKRSLSTDTMLSAPNSIANKTVSAMKAGLLAPSDFIMKNLGGIIQRFAKGGMATAPLIDDIVNATGTMMPRPSSAIAALISAGGGAIDIDRTIKRTIGDKAYSMAKTSGQQSAALERYFRDPQARLRDVTSAPLTTFGRELQAAIKSGQLKPGKLSIVSKSQRVPGVAEYLSRLFGIPLANMIFTGGGSKQPAMDALRTKGPRAMRKFATGGGVGTDTVPALLTPGEFVINKKSAQAIGYGSLNRMNKVGKYAKGGVVNGQNVQGFRFGGQVAEKNIADSFNREGYALVTSMTEVQKIFNQFVGDLTTLPSNLKKIVSEVETFQLTKNDKFKTNSGERSGDQLRGISMGGKVGINIGQAGTHTVKHEASHEVDQALGGGKASSRTAGTFQHKIATELQKTMEKELGVSAYRLDLAELFADALAKVPPEVKKILVSTTDAAEGSKKLAEHFNKVGGPVAGLADLSADEFGGTQSKRSSARGSSGSSPRNPTRAQSMGMSTSSVLAAARSQAASSSVSGGGGGGGGGGSPITQNTQAVAKNTQAQKSAAGSAMQVVNNNKMFAASMATSLIAGFLPAVDENSGAMLRMTHSLLGLVTTITSVGFALEAFGIKLGKGGLMDLMGGMIGKGAGKGLYGLATKAGGAAGSAVLGAGGGANLAIAASTFTSALTTVAVPILAATATFYAVQSAGNSLVEAFMNYDSRLKKAIEGGNIESARNLGAAQQSSRTAVNTLSGAAGGAVAGAAIGSVIPIIGTGIGAAIGAVAGAVLGDALSDTSQYAGQVAATQASLVKSQNALTKASEDSAKALTQFEKGTISAQDLLASTSAGTAAVAQSRAEADKLIKVSDANRDTETGSIFRSVLTLGGLLGESGGAKDARINAEQEKATQEVKKQEQEAIRVAQPGMNALAKQVAMTGGSFDDLMARIKQTDPNLYDILIRQGTNDLNTSFQNIAKEAARTQAALEAANLGLRGAQATSTAMSASMDRFAAGLEVGGSSFSSNAEFLSQAMSSAAQAMDPDDIKAAISDVSKNLSDMGVSEKYTQRFENNMNAFTSAQQNYGKAFDNIIAESKAMGTVFSADVLKDKFADQLGDMMGPDVSDEAKENFKKIVAGIELSPDEINEIMSGNYKAFGDKLTEAGQKQVEEIIKIAQERQKAEQVVIGLIQKRAEAERNLAQAQKDAIDMYMEGRDIQAKYGGRAVTADERRGAILAKANTGAERAGVGTLTTGSAAELRQRQMQIVGGFANIEQRRSQNGGMSGTSGVEASETQRALDQAQKDQVETIRSLIKLEEDELKILQEKNRLEKSSLESLLSGDVDKFFQGQATMGAQAAIAAGDMRTANMYGAQAISDAFADIQKQMEAGVQTMFGMQLGGPGGLAERAASAALGSRGITDPRMAQVMAGTTAQEESSKARLRELGSALADAGMAGAAMAEMEVQTANINVENAELKLTQIEERGRQAAANMYRGGVVYANRGMFVPRGTDTVPAMLTPGEFVVRREAVNRGNNLQLLHAMNNGKGSGGFARGGKVGYYNSGGRVQYKQLGGQISNVGLDEQLITNLNNAFTSFINRFNESIKNLQNTKVQVQMAPTTVNVNFTGTSMLNQISDEAKTQLTEKIVEAVRTKLSVGSGGKLVRNDSGLPSTR